MAPKGHPDGAIGSAHDEYANAIVAVSAAEWLDPETIVRLIARHGSPENAATKAERDPRFEQAFRGVKTAQMYGVATG
jgi:hypothetical protein